MENNKAKTIMIQGTASDSGKSILTTALCRAFARKGIKTAPFKAWNMSLNSYVTKGGAEVGIAQALQARAALREVTVDMQPILVKAMGEGKTQLVIRGQVVENISYQERQHDYVEIYKKTIRDSLKKLRENNDLIIMEGAGSPAEINRKTPDFANMFTAEIYKTPVFLISSIEKGGSLASLVGTLKLLKRKHRNLVKGLIINKFRGDFELLKPAFNFLEDYTKKEVIGVLPYLKDLNLPEEDSASLRSNYAVNSDHNLKIAVIKLPHLSNFSDFNALKMEKNLNLEYINKKQNLLNFDLIIIPGTKTTTKDLIFLKESGLAAEIKKANQKGKMIIGICGGFQILGQKLIDPKQTEGGRKEIKGLGLLAIETEFLAQKTTHQAEVIINQNLTNQQIKAHFAQANFKGYEIHMGQTNYLNGAEALFELKERSGQEIELKDGAINKAGNCFGSYLHGLFDNNNFRRKILNLLRKNKNLTQTETYNYQAEIEKNLDRLADTVEANLDLDKFLELSRWN
jgi:adenosylcobyric acid synthase